NAWTSSKHDLQNYLVTANHNQDHAKAGISGDANGVRFLGIRTEGFIASPKIGDNGVTVLSTGDTLHVLDFNLNDHPLGGSSSVGDYAGISDGADPWIAFAANHGQLGKGIYVTKASDTSKWYKVVGLNQDGHLDPNDAWGDTNGNGKYDSGEDFSALT